MTSHRLLTATIAAVLLFTTVGCRPKRMDNPEVYRAAAANVAEIRQRYQRRDPQTQVGLVLAANPSVDMVAVGEVDPSQFRPGDIVSFVDTSENPLTSGRVIRVLTDSLHVRYDPPIGSRRAPREGDVMIRFRPAT
jgi:hypothetical protein